MNEHEVGRFAKARAQARVEATALRGRAVRTVADQAVDDEDFRRLLAMLGLEAEAGGTATLGSGLAGYVRAVAAQVRVPVEGTGFEISDTATAYVGLTERWSRCPDRDLMLVWAEQHGWYLALETGPAEPPVVLAYLGGGDVVPDPYAVARFVGDVLAGRLLLSTRPLYTVSENRTELAKRLAGYVTADSHRGVH